MATDFLVLGGFVFTDFAVPERMPFGGRQAMAIHKLPGGSRVIDTLGPDDADITWSGRFWSDSAAFQAMALDAMRASGAELPLIFGGQFYMVVISEFKAEIERFPQDVPYSITCVVSQNPMQGALGSMVSGISSLISADLSSAMGVLGL